jgi:4-hydroxybenzoate polyprenyltransferase
MRRFIEKLENTEMSFGAWLAAFVGVVVIRFFFETFSSPTAAFPAAPDTLTMVHYFLFFIGAFISCSLVVAIFVPDIGRITKLLIFLAPILWLPPIVDMVRSGGTGYMMSYIFAGGISLWRDFLSFGGPSPFGGVTLGIKVELAIIVVGLAGYVFLKSRSFLKAVATAVISYGLVFFWLAIPSFIAMLAVGAGATASMSAAQVLNSVVGLFSLSHIAANFVRPVEQFWYSYGFGIVLNVGLSHFIYLIDSFLAGLWFFAFRPGAMRAVIKNMRPGRALHFGFMVVVGIGAALLAGGKFINWADGMMLATVLVAFLCAWLFSVGTNDAVDVAIDRVSNSDRPLVTGALDCGLLRSINFFFFAWALIGGFIAGYWAFFLVSIFIAAYYIYSIPPLRLKRVPILATFLIALASLTAAMAGFYLLSPGKFIGDFPPRFALIILVFFTLYTNIKDVKDIAGDRADGIATIPSVFGETTGRRIVGLLSALAFVLVGAISHSLPIMGLSVAAAFAVYVVVATGRYREWPAFLVYFVYAIMVIFLVAGRLFS